MRKFAQIFSVILFFGVFFTFSVFAQEEAEWTREALQDMYTQFLREEGYLPSIDEDGDILFKVSGNNYFIIIDENDIQFFRIYRGVSLGSFSPQTALAVANNLNIVSKIAKVYISTDERSAAINTELLLSDPRDFRPVLSRALSLMMFAENNFFSRLRDEALIDEAP